MRMRSLHHTAWTASSSLQTGTQRKFVVRCAISFTRMKCEKNYPTAFTCDFFFCLLYLKVVCFTHKLSPKEIPQASFCFSILSRLPITYISSGKERKENKNYILIILAKNYCICFSSTASFAYCIS